MSKNFRVASQTALALLGNLSHCSAAMISGWNRLFSFQFVLKVYNDPVRNNIKNQPSVFCSNRDIPWPEGYILAPNPALKKSFALLLSFCLITKFFPNYKVFAFNLIQRNPMPQSKQQLLPFLHFGYWQNMKLFSTIGNQHCWSNNV